MRKSCYIKPLSNILLLGIFLLTPLFLFAQEDCDDKNVDHIYHLIISAQENEDISTEKMIKGDMSFQQDFEKMMSQWEEATELTFGGSPCLAKKVLAKVKEISYQKESLKKFIQMLEAVLKYN